MINYEEKYKSLIDSFRETLCNIYENAEDIKYFKETSDEEIIGCIEDLVYKVVEQPSQQMMALQFEVMRNAFSR